MVGFSLVPKAACPYCYYRVDPRSIMIRCTGRPAPGREACTLKEDPARNRGLGDSTPVLPSFAPPRGRLSLGSALSGECPNCFGRSGIRVCPQCHSVLPASFGGRSPMFGVVGVKGSGKTVMLTVLSKELKTSVARRFDASIDDVGSSALMRKMARWRDQMDSGGQLPESTAEFNPAETVPAVLEWRYERKGVAGISRDEATVLSFYDTAGEDLKTLEGTRNQHYLAAADGLIVLLDPFGFRANRDRGLAMGIPETQLEIEPVNVLGSITTMLREEAGKGGRKKVDRPMAIVVSKIDAFFRDLPPEHPVRQPGSNRPLFDEAESRSVHDHIEALIHDWDGDDVLAHLRLNYERYRFFAASALGAEPEYRSERVNSRGVLPHRVAEPLLWLMSLRGFIPKAG